jgi:uncharacterized protein (TIGR02246 family)
MKRGRAVASAITLPDGPHSFPTLLGDGTLLVILLAAAHRCLEPAMPFSTRCRSASLVFGALALCFFGGAGCSAAEESRAADEAAIRAATKTYLEALAKGDAAALAALWTPDGDIVDAYGNLLPGRRAIDADAPKEEQPDRPEFHIAETRLRFLTADVAIEDGTVEVVPSTGPPLTGRFSATWLKHDGTWKLAAVREARGEEPTAEAALADLDWMVGDWVVVDAPVRQDDPTKPQIEVSARWNATKTYLTRTMTITPGTNVPPLEITQRIGWDPLSKSVHSWVFGSDGSHGEANWTRDGKSWVAQARAIHPDGSQSTSLNIYTYDGKDRCVWKSLPTHVGSEAMPTVNMTMVRKPASTKQEEKP